MKPKLTKKTVIIVGVFATLALVGWAIILLINANNKTTEGPTRDRMPPHIEQVSPADGEEVTEWQGYCVHFKFQIGNGMGINPESKIVAYLNGEDITASRTGIVSLDYPPSYASYCFDSSIKILPGWHTAKVIYSDNRNIKFSYTWRILMNGE